MKKNNPSEFIDIIVVDGNVATPFNIEKMKAAIDPVIKYLPDSPTLKSKKFISKFKK